jgi:WD40-like Beta Propeller Repeat
VREAHWEEQDFDDVLWLGGRLSWSPDGKLLAFSDRASPNEQPSISLLSLDSLGVRGLTLPSRLDGDYNPAFSPDGQTLAFNRRLSICTARVSGGDEHCLSSGAQYGWGLAWAPDGRDIVFAKAGWLANAGWLWKISAHSYVPMAEPFKKILNVIVVVAVVLWLLSAFGIFSWDGTIGTRHRVADSFTSFHGSLCSPMASFASLSYLA